MNKSKEDQKIDKAISLIEKTDTTTISGIERNIIFGRDSQFTIWIQLNHYLCMNPV